MIKKVINIETHVPKLVQKKMGEERQRKEKKEKEKKKKKRNGMVSIPGP